MFPEARLVQNLHVPSSRQWTSCLFVENRKVSDMIPEVRVCWVEKPVELQLSKHVECKRQSPRNCSTQKMCGILVPTQVQRRIQVQALHRVPRKICRQEENIKRRKMLMTTCRAWVNVVEMNPTPNLSQQRRPNGTFRSLKLSSNCR